MKSTTLFKILNLTRANQARVDWPQPSQEAERRISRSCPILFDLNLFIDRSSQLISLPCAHPPHSMRATVNIAVNGTRSPFIRCPSRNANLRPLNLFPSIGIVATLATIFSPFQPKLCLDTKPWQPQPPRAAAAQQASGASAILRLSTPALFKGLLSVMPRTHCIA